MIYQAKAKLESGQVLTKSGSFDECAQWCESVIHDNPGSVDVWIKEIEKRATVMRGGTIRDDCCRKLWAVNGAGRTDRRF